jgi:hypothetical protein
MPKSWRTDGDGKGQKGSGFSLTPKSVAKGGACGWTVYQIACSD